MRPDSDFDQRSMVAELVTLCVKLAVYLMTLVYARPKMSFV